MVDVKGLFRRAKAKGADLAQNAPERARDLRARGEDAAKGAPDRAREAAKAAPEQARRLADEARRTGRAVGEVLDDRTDGRFGAAVAKGGEAAGKVKARGSDAVDAVKARPGELRDAFRDGEDEGYRAERYRPDPIDAPAPHGPPPPHCTLGGKATPPPPWGRGARTRGLETTSGWRSNPDHEEGAIPLRRGGLETSLRSSS
ncbi:MAG: hypothetical protein Q4G43_14495, partial [Mobilicoccus sp.]|nr:hypothetical protein [Mobilicoccus sp.]